MKNDHHAATIALALSGAAALGHQLLWTRRLTDLLGAGSEASARVIGTFFLGLALGAAIAGVSLPRVKNRWRFAATAEWLSAVLCLPIAFLPSVSDWLWPKLGPDSPGTWLASMVRLVISIAVVLPPATAIGMSLPMILGGIDHRGPTTSARSIHLYSIYTAGGAAGLAFLVVVGLQRLGAPGSMIMMMAFNLAAAGVCGSRANARGADQAEPSVREMNPIEAAPTCLAFPLRLSLAAFFSGAGIVAIEVLTTELFNLTVPLAFYPQSAILFSIVTLLAIAAALVSRFLSSLRSWSHSVTWILSLAGVLVALIPLIFVHGIASWVSLGYADSITGFAVQMLGTGIGVLCAPLLVAGSLFPVLMAISSAEGPARLARMFAANGIGGLVGAEMALRILLPIQGVHAALGLLGCLYAMAALVWAFSMPKLGGASRLAPSLGALFACILLIFGPISRLPVFIDAPSFHVLSIQSSREGSLAVVERGDFGRGMIIDNQYLLGASGAKPEMQRQAHIPLLLHPKPQKVLFLGLATGITGSGALLHKPVESITSVEISPLVAGAAKRYFPEFNDGFCEHPKVRTVVDDARTFVLSAVAQFDVIIGDLFTPWRPGESQLCSLEQFQAARRALRPNGVFCQWLPMHQLTRDQFDTIAATFRQAFPRTYLFRNHLKARKIPVALIGFTDGALNWEVVRSRVQEATQGGVQDPLCRHVEGLAMLCLGEVAPGHDGESLNSLANLRIELSAAQNLILKGYKSFMAGESRAWSDFVESQVAYLQQGEVMPAPLRRLPWIGLWMTQHDAAIRHRDPSAQQWLLSIRDAIPLEIRADTNADWSFCSGELLVDP